MPLYFCKTCARAFDSKLIWGDVPCPKCNSTKSTIRWSVEQDKRRLRQMVNDAHPLVRMDVQSRLFSFLDEKGLALVSLVCSRWQVAAQRLLTNFIPQMTAYGSMSHTLKNVLIAPKDGLLIGARDLQLAVDQFPFPKGKYDSSVLNFIIENNITIDLSLGTDDVDTRQALIKAAQSVRVIDRFKKMHNKVWVIDKQGVIVGSPNVSFSGLDGGNIESFIMIRSTRVGMMFAKYLQMLKAPTPKVFKQLSDQICREMMAYNKQSHRLKVALAPIINITDFVAEELKGAVKIVVRQFLVSHKNEYDDQGPGLDIVDVLCGMARQDVDIEIVLDEGAYEKQKFVRIAAEHLADAGCKVYLQKPVYVVSSHGERLMHDKLILATLHNGVKRTLMGSAGFTSNVIANENAECFISTDLDDVFQSMLIHSDKAKKTQPTKRIFQ